MPADKRGDTAKGAEEPDANEQRRTVGLGRKVVLAFWGVGIAYTTVVAFYSIVPQALFPERAAEASAPDAPRADATACEAQLRGLYGELMARAAEQTRSPSEDPAENAGFFAEWDRRHISLTGQCDESLHANLGRLRHRIQTSLRRYEREEGRLARSLARRLEGDGTQHASRHTESQP